LWSKDSIRSGILIKLPTIYETLSNPYAAIDFAAAAKTRMLRIYEDFVAAM